MLTEQSPHSDNFRIEVSTGIDGHGFNVHTRFKISGTGEPGKPSLPTFFKKLEALGVVSDLPSDAQTEADFFGKLKRVRDIPRPDYIYMNYDGLSISIALITHPDHITGNEVEVTLGVFNKLKTPNWRASAPPFKTKKKEKQARELLVSLLQP